MINVAIAPDDNYIIPASVVLTSLLENKKDDICVFVLYIRGNLNENNKNALLEIANRYISQLHFLEVAPEEFSIYPILRHGLSAYLRLYLPRLVTELEKIIYLDCDIVVDHNLDELYNLDVSNYFFAAVTDLWTLDKTYLMSIGYSFNRPYINTGVVVMNLEKMRQLPLVDMIRDYLSKHINAIRFSDQDIINVLFEEILILHPKYNVNINMWNNRKVARTIWNKDEIKEAVKIPYVIHYITAFKPWYKGVTHKFKRKWYKYVSLTPYSDSVPIENLEIKKLLIKYRKAMIINKFIAIAKIVIPTPVINYVNKKRVI